MSDPLAARQLELKEQAIKVEIDCKAVGKVYEAAKGQYMEVEINKQNNPFVS